MNDQLNLIFQVVSDSLKSWSQFFQQSILSFKQLTLEQSYRVIGSQLSDLMFGLVFGAQNSLNSSIQHSFKIMGMLHIWSASGFNVNLFSGTVFLLLNIVSYLSYFFKTILLLLSTLFFWYISGQGPSMQRAVLMTGLSLLVRRLFFRQLKPLRSLIYAVLLILALDFSFFESLSLRFSVAAVAGIITLNPLFLSWRQVFLKNKLGSTPTFTRRKNRLAQLLNHFVRNLALFFSVQIALVPLISSTWGEIGFLSIISNSLLSGFLPILVTLGIAWFGWSVFSLSWLTSGLSRLGSLLNLSRVLGMFITVPLNLFLNIGQVFTQLELGTLKIPEFTTVHTWVWYLGWGILGWWCQKKLVKQKTKPLAINIFSNPST